MTTKLSISFTDLHANIIEDAVKSRQYASASEFVREALRLREKRIDDAIDAGIASGFAEPDELVRTKQARSDLLDIWLHIAADNEAAATEFPRHAWPPRPQ